MGLPIPEYNSKVEKLDEFDKKILYELAKDGRISTQKIASNVGKSRNFVDYRLSRMKESGVLIGLVAVLDTSKLGYTTYALYLQMNNATEMDVFIDYLHKRREVWGINRVIGKYQLFLTVYVKNINELKTLISDFGQQFGPMCGDYRLLMMYSGHALAHNFLFKGYDLLHQEDLRHASNKIELSEKELKMISLISRNPLISLTQMAKEIKASKARTKDIFEGLKKKKVLLWVRPSINATKLGYLPKHILIKLKFSAMNKLDTMRKYFLELRCTKAISLTFGNYDLQGRFIFEDVHKFQAFQEHIWNKFGQYVTEIYSDDYYEDVPFTPGKVSWEENGMNK